MGLRVKEEAITKRASCKFDIRNSTNTCLLQAQPCKFKGKEDTCPHMKKEKDKGAGTYGEFKFSWHRM